MDTNAPIRDHYSRITAILKGEKPDRLPLIDRLELWYLAHERANNIPAPYTGMSLTELHRAVGFGQQKMMYIYHVKLNGVEVVCRLNGEEFYRETNPTISDFPRGHVLAQQDKPGVTEMDFITPMGKLTIKHELLPSMVASGLTTYKTEHFIKDMARDFPIVQYILERVEYIPQFAQIQAEQARIGAIGYVLPMLIRIPFQEIMIDYIGEVDTFYLMHDEPALMDKFMAIIDEHVVHMLHGLKDYPGLLIEFGDNLESQMTNPKLFQTHCLPYYQRYADIIHGQGKKMSSHTDGNLKPLLGLLKETGLDICESVAPYPLTPSTFEEIWETWDGHPLIWGGIPSPILEERCPEDEFQAYVERVLNVIGSRPIILGVSDMVLDINKIERVKWYADRVEAHVI